MFAIMLIFVVSVPGFAAVIPEEEYVPLWEPVCGNKAYHEMVSHWHGYAYVNGEEYIKFGCAWQCSGCNYVMITEGDVTLDSAIAVGKWAGYGASYKLNATEYVTIFAEEWGECYDSNTLPGYKFVNA